MDSSSFVVDTNTSGSLRSSGVYTRFCFLFLGFSGLFLGAALRVPLSGSPSHGGLCSPSSGAFGSIAISPDEEGSALRNLIR